MRGGGGGRQGEAGGVAAVKGGRQAHPPKVQKVIFKKLKKKENKLALCSAIAATQSKEIIKSRGHKIENLKTFPIVISDDIESITKTKEALKILDKISHTRQTFFKTPLEVINIPKPNNSAYTAGSLRNHMDLPYYETPPGYQFLHCLVNEAEGGNSSAVDGFKVADYLKHNDKETFNILKRIPIKFVNKDYTQNKHRVFHAPAITLTKDGDYNDIRFSMTYMGVIDCSSEDVEPFYKAHYKFAKLIHSEKFNIKFRLESGDIFCFNNRRILHGRTEYNPNSGNRHLQGYYIDRDEIISRLNYLKKIDTSLL